MTQLLITGASSGIGLSTAQRFLPDADLVINLSRRPCPEPNVHHITCDLADPEFIQTIGPLLVEQIDVTKPLCIVHNAALLHNDSAASTTSEDLTSVMQVNVIAPNTLNRLLLPNMTTGSSVLYIGSTLSEKAVPNSYSYVTSKHANVGMMRATCQDLAGSGVHTACICPGFTDTQMLREHVRTDAMATVSAMSAFNRLVTPEEIADTLHWAAHSPVINGSVIHANLGQIER